MTMLYISWVGDFMLWLRAGFCLAKVGGVWYNWGVDRKKSRYVLESSSGNDKRL